MNKTFPFWVVAKARVTQYVGKYYTESFVYREDGMSFSRMGTSGQGIAYLDRARAYDEAREHVRHELFVAERVMEEALTRLAVLDAESADAPGIEEDDE